MSETALVENAKVNRDLADNIAIDKGGINFANAGEVMEFAKMMAASGSAVPKHLRGQPGSCLGILDDAIRLGVNPYALARKSYFVNDMLAYEAQVFMAIVNARAPLKTRPDIRFEGEGLDKRAIVTGIFRDGSVREYKSPRIADIQPKNSPLWKSDEEQQLSYYSLRGFARRWCPEVILGIHDVDELREAAMVDVSPKQEAPKSLDDFAAAAEAGGVLQQERSGSTADSGPDESAAGGGGSPSSPPSAISTAAADPQSEAGLRDDLIKEALLIATDDSLDEDDRIAALDGRQVVWAERLPDADFCHQVLTTAVKVARGQLKPDAAKKFMARL